MRILKFKFFFEKKYKLKNDTSNEFELQSAYNYPMYPRNSKKNSYKGFVNIDNGSTGGTQWTCFIVKNNKSFYFDSCAVNQINFYSNNYVNQKYIINIKHKI